MRVSFRLKGPLGRLAKKARLGKDPRVTVRVILGVLLAANIAAALILFKPWGASPAEMEQQLGEMRRQLRQRQESVERLQTIVAMVERAREDGDDFMKVNFIDRRTASSTIVSELKDAAGEAGIKQEDHTFTYEPVEGSEILSMMSISGNYEGAYSNLVKFINLLDASPRFLILDTLTVAPERSAGTLNVNLKLNAFVIQAAEQADIGTGQITKTMGDADDRTEEAGG